MSKDIQIAYLELLDKIADLEEKLAREDIADVIEDLMKTLQKELFNGK